MRGIKTSDENKIKMLKMYNEDKMSLEKIAKYFDVAISTVHRILNQLNYTPRSNREQALKYSFNEDYFENINNEHKAYWLGYICADGTIYEKTQTDSGILKLEMKKSDKELAQKFKVDVESTHSIKYYTNKHYKGYIAARLVLKSNKIISDLAKYGVGAKKSLTLQFPQQLITSKFVNAFIRGYFDGDGSIGKGDTKTNPYDIRVLGTEKFLQTIQQITNIKCRISQPKGKIYELRISARDERKKFLTFIYKDATIYLQRKYNRYKEFMQKYYSNS